MVRGWIYKDLGQPLECTLNVNFQVFRQKRDGGLVFLGIFVILLLGRLFGRFCVDVLITGDVKSIAMGGLFKTKGSRKLGKYAFGCDWYAILGGI